MTLRNRQPNPARTVGTFSPFRATTRKPKTAPREGLRPLLTAFASVAGSGLRGYLIYDLGIPRDIC
jgi:hypothetical protein